MGIRLLSIDPGTKLAGYAVFDTSDLTPNPVYLKQYGFIRVGVKIGLEARLFHLAVKLAKVLTECKPSMMVIEFPQFQGGIKGNAAARQGTTLDVAAACGCILNNWIWYGREWAVRGVTLPLPVFVHPVKWKGQLPKEATMTRCSETYGIEWSKKNEHNIADAIMIGDWWLKEEKIRVIGTGEKLRRDY
jgi:hypothetical protein